MINWLLTQTPLMFLTQSFWRDEAFSYLMAKQPLWMIPSLTAKDFNPPLYYILLHIYMWIFGHSEIMLRVFSLIFFNITIVFAYKIIDEVFAKKSTSRWLYLAFFAFNPFMLYYGLEARMYAMTACFATLSWYFMWTGRPRKYLLVTILGLYTHYFFLFIAGSQLLYVLLSKQKTRLQKTAFIKRLVPAGIAFGVWVLFLLTQQPPVGKQFWIAPPTAKLILNTPAVLLTGYESVFGFPNFSLIPYTLLFVAALIAGYKSATRNEHDKDIVLGLLSWTFIPALITIFLTPIKPLFLPRYLMVSAPGILFLTMFLIMRMRTRQIRAAFLGLFLIAFIAYHKLQIDHRRKANFRRVSQEIKLLAGKDDVVYVENELNLHPAQYYFEPGNVFIIGKTYEEIPDYVGKILIPRDRVTSQFPRYPQKAFIIHEDLSYSIQSIY